MLLGNYNTISNDNIAVNLGNVENLDKSNIDSSQGLIKKLSQSKLDINHKNIYEVNGHSSVKTNNELIVDIYDSEVEDNYGTITEMGEGSVLNNNYGNVVGNYGLVKICHPGSLVTKNLNGGYIGYVAPGAKVEKKNKEAIFA
ncbi:MAG: hypothetical protein HRT47_03830 [Candidatus Caenarcaniphilales bacterium]|nr:hypothetical protein [Candidatus Caenarcaniphilales bacterium]